MDVYQSQSTLCSAQVDAHRTLRLSALFTLMQEAAFAHAEQLGVGKAQTLDRNILWVVVRQDVEVLRMPQYLETVTLTTWPAQRRFVLYPRYFCITDASGQDCIRATTLWTLIDGDTRKFAEQAARELPVSEATRPPLFRAMAPSPLPIQHTAPFVVPYSYLDFNGHMNNTRYFDVCEDRIAPPRAGKRLLHVRSEYVKEARLDEQLTIGWASDQNRFYFAGDAAQRCFSIDLTYAE